MTILDFQPKKLSLRWGQLFTTFLQTPQERTGESKRAETGETEPSQSLHAFMQQTLNEHRGSKLDDALPTSRILFVSDDNAARTQIASAYTRWLGGEQVFVRSVGLAPAYHVDPLVIEVLNERGVPTDDLKPKNFNPHTLGNIDEIITFDDDAHVSDDVKTWNITKNISTKADIHAMCDEVEARVRKLLSTLGITPTPHKNIIPEFLAA
ncbi:arsenate-mycothiol transferase ArsC [Corynebacterium matruchotii]